jgi:2-hydroxychromene-2-carboxylate isomerase
LTVHRVEFWFDPISPFAYLAFEQLPEALVGLSLEVVYRPVLFAGLLAHWGQKGPAEIEPKRAWTFRHLHWLARRQGIAMQTPPQHPFNPLAHLRLLLACAPAGDTPNRRVCEAVFRHIWRGGLDAHDAERLRVLALALAPRVAPDDPSIKQALKDATHEAITRDIFGVPSFVVDGRVFWGADALPMLADHLGGGEWFEGVAWDTEGAPRAGIRR